MRITSAVIKDYLRQPYTTTLLPDATKGYTAAILEWPGCVAEGDTVTQALAALYRAAGAWLRAALAQGQTIPPPLGTHDCSGKIALRLPKSLHRQALASAACEGVSLNQFLLTAIALRLGAVAGAAGQSGCSGEVSTQ